MNKRNLILASSSPRRIEMMQKHGYPIIIRPADIDETLPDNITPEHAVQYLALKKAYSCEKNLMKNEPHLKGSIIIGADTVVYKEHIMGKPRSRREAEEMLRSIRNTCHQVATGVAVIIAGETCKKNEKVFCDITKVYCADFTDKQLNEYLDTDEPYDKAGSYAIQGLFGKYIEKIEGSFDTVVGLPIDRLEKVLTKDFQYKIIS